MRLQITMLILILTAIASVAGFYLAPNSREIALMRLEDKNFKEAFDYYREHSLHGEESINILAPLIKIYLHYGYSDMAITLMEAYVKENPNSVQGRKQLTALYKSSQYYYKYCESLEALEILSPSVENLTASRL